MQSVQLDCEKVHTRSCEFLDNVRLYYIRSTERLIWDPAKFSHTLFLSDRWGLTEATAGQIWSKANIQYEPVGEETLNNSNNNKTLFLTQSLSLPRSDSFLDLHCLILSNFFASLQIFHNALVCVFNSTYRKSNLTDRKTKTRDDGQAIAGRWRVEKPWQ